MMNIQLSDELTKIAQSLAAQKNVSVDKIVEEALIALQSQIDEIDNDYIRFKKEIDKFSEKANAAQPELLKSILAAGVPLFYTDAQGRHVKEMPSGEIIVLNEELK